MVLTLQRSADFAIDKPADEPCPNLDQNFRCKIHQGLREKGFPGCVAFDCHGAGQKVTQHTFAGEDWQSKPEIAAEMSHAFRIMWQLHLSLRYLTEALELPAASALHDVVRRATEEIEQLTLAAPEELLAVDIAAHKREVNALLWQVSETVRCSESPSLKEQATSER